MTTPTTALRFGLHRGRGVVSRAIQLQTRSPYSHVSLVLPSGRLLEALQGRGVVVQRALVDVQREERVDVVSVPCTTEQRAAAHAFAIGQLGKAYDYSSVFRFVSRRQASRKAARVWFCSELAFATAQAAGITLLGASEPWEVSPGLFARSPLLRWPLAAGVRGRVRLAPGWLTAPASPALSPAT